MKRSRYALHVLWVGALAGCSPGVKGSGVPASQKRELTRFDRVKLSGAGFVEVAIGNDAPLQLSGDDNILPLIETEVVDRCLHIRPSESIRPTRLANHDRRRRP